MSCTTQCRQVKFTERCQAGATDDESGRKQSHTGIPHQVSRCRAAHSGIPSDPHLDHRTECQNRVRRDVQHAAATWQVWTCGIKRATHVASRCARCHCSGTAGSGAQSQSMQCEAKRREEKGSIYPQACAPSLEAAPKTSRQRHPAACPRHLRPGDQRPAAPRPQPCPPRHRLHQRHHRLQRRHQ